ncbi:serine/threonine protein kinase [Streptomyces prasinus]|uniref:serine/threonine protein kinase n=1 Tax=Streptomyces prasinus TaxID=67345 RepID=UPI0033D7DE43
MEPLRSEDPRRLGRFRLLSRIGAGGFGEVFLGREEPGGRERFAAVKLIRTDIAESERLRPRLHSEIEAVGRAGGEGVPELLDADPAARRPWLATRYVPGPSLQRLVDDAGPLPETTVLALGRRLAGTLAALHGSGLHHRDLKPSNVLVTATRPWIIDFSLVRLVADPSLTVTADAMGSFQYAAPEQASGLGRARGPADVFAFAATLLFAATGHPPRSGRNQFDVRLRALTEPPDTTGLRDGPLRDLVTACLRFTDTERPTMDDVHAGLARPTEADRIPYPPAALHALGHHMDALRALIGPDADRLVREETGERPEEGEPFTLAGPPAGAEEAHGGGTGNTSTLVDPDAHPGAGPDRTRHGASPLPPATLRDTRTEDRPVPRPERARARPGPRTAVTVALDGDGHPRGTEPEPLPVHRDGRALPHPADADTPRPRATAADVLLLLELGGTRAESERRLHFLRSVLHRLATAAPPGPGTDRPGTGRTGAGAPGTPADLRIGLVGYEDHEVLPVRAVPENDSVLSSWGPGTAEDAAEAVRRFPVRPVRHDYGAPLEDALYAAAHWRHWRDGARHLLLVLARRPPHPARQQSDLSLPCPDRYDYEEALRRLRTAVCPDLTVVAVRDATAGDPSGHWRPRTRERLRHIWRDLGRDHLFTLGTHTPEDVASCVGHALGRPAEAPGPPAGPATAPVVPGAARRPGTRTDSPAVPPSQKDSEHHA